MISKRSQNMELTSIIFLSCVNTSKIKYRTSTLFRRTFFDVISMGKKSTLFWCTLFNVVSMGKKSTSFQRIRMGELPHVTSMLSTLFRNYPRYFVGKIIDVISISFLWHDFDGLKIVFIFYSKFDRRKFNVIWLYYFDSILTDWKLTQLQHAFCDMFLKGKNYYSLLHIFW